MAEENAITAPLAPAVAPPPPAPLAPRGAPLGFEPRNIDELTSVANFLKLSSLVPKALMGKPADIMLVMWQGLELGLLPVQALTSIHVIEGRPSLSAQAKVALCLREPQICKYFVPIESTEKAATFETWRVGAPQATRFTYTIEYATTAGLVSKDNWRKNPKAMLRARAESQLADMVYPDVIKGMISSEEAGDLSEQPREVEVNEVAEPVSRVDQVTKQLGVKAPPAGQSTVDGKTAPAKAPAAAAPAAASSPPAAKVPTALPPLDALGQPLRVMVFGPHKGKALIYLSGEELALQRMEAERQLEENKKPNAAWVPKVRQNLADIVAEQTKRFEKLQADNAAAKANESSTPPPATEKAAPPPPAEEPPLTDEDAPF
jgi:hypothetical protein